MKTGKFQNRRRSPLTLEPLESRIMLSATTTALPVADAFPFINGAVWAYATMEKGQAGTGSTTMTSPDANHATMVEGAGGNSETAVFTSASTGIYLTKLQTSSGYVTFNNAEFLPSVLAPGESWSSKSTGTAYLGAGTLAGTFTSSGKATGWTKVMEPAGTYEAMLVKDTVTFTGSGTLYGVPGSFTMTETDTMYLVPGVGIVQAVLQASWTGKAQGLGSQTQNVLYTSA